jgi:hypothetical protein
MISPFGWGAPGAAVNQRNNDNGPDGNFFDQDCTGSISWGDAGPGDPDHRFNWIDFGSETLTQLGWNFVNLSTEYELLGRSSQTEEQQRVLEEIFLGIQAIRRLDMQAQCMIKEMYDNRSPGEDLVCEEPYSVTGPEDINPFNSQPCHRHWDAHVQDDCGFTPDFSGYNGFFLRGDAGQNLENILNDSTDESYNVDAVGGAFGGSI